jgi:hypothetical protein
MYAMKIPKWGQIGAYAALSTGNGHCCISNTGRSSLEPRLKDAPWQTNVSRTRSSIHRPLSFAFPATSVLLATALALGAAAVYAQDPAPATPQKAAGAQATPDQGTTAATPSGDAAAGGAQTGTTSSGGPSSGGTSKPPVVCFKLTGRCVERPKGQSATRGAAAKDGTSNKRPLNLTAPDVRTVVPADELKEPLPTNDQITETQESQTVQVKKEGPPPDVPGGFGALWWALNHPSQAWRILTPAE